MRELIFGILSLALVFSFSISTAYAHVAGQIPFFKVNGQYSNLYPIPTTSLLEFRLPQDDSPDLYLINSPIEFELDAGRLPIPPEVLQDTTFIWDFGDGNIKNGSLKEIYTYTKSGSYVLELRAKTKQISEAQLIQSTLIHVVPSKPYTLPKSVIRVNGESVKEPLVDMVKTEFGENFSLDGSTSQDGTAKITEYFWDLGDGKSDQNAKLTYLYKKEQYAYFPVLRVTDENGLFSDSYLQITNSLNEDEESGTRSDIRSQISASKVIYFILGGVVLIVLWGISFPLRRKLFRRKK